MGQYFIRWHGMVDGWDLSPDRHVDFIRKFNQDEDFDPPWGWLFMTGLAVGFSSPVILILLIFYVLNCHTRARHPIH